MAWTNLDAEITVEGDLVGSLAHGEEVPCGSVGGAGASAALEHHQALPLVEVDGERGEMSNSEKKGPCRAVLTQCTAQSFPSCTSWYSSPSVLMVIPSFIAAR